MGWFSVWRRWGTLAPGMRRALALAMLTALTGTSVLLYQTTVRSEGTVTFSQGDRAAGSNGELEPFDPFATPLASPTPPPNAGRSQHTLFAPEQRRFEGGGEAGKVTTPLPDAGRYTFAVSGDEEATGFGRRDLPTTMTMTADHDTPPGAPNLSGDEIAFHLEFSSDREEAQVASYRPEGVSFSFESSSVTFGPVPESSAVTYRPSLLQVPFPLDFGVKRTGTSQAREDGEVVRTDDWSIGVVGRDTIEVAGRSVDTWVVTFERHSRSGSSEKLDQSRQYWFDPARLLWVKWTEDLRTERPLGPGTFTYRAQYTATLTGYQPIS